MKRLVLPLFLTALFTLVAPAQAKPEVLYYYQNDERHQYQIELLEHVLTLTQEEYGRLQARYKALPTHRDGLWALSTGDIDITWYTSTKRNVATFLPVEIPLMQGMLGYRLLLTTEISQRQFKYIYMLGDLKKNTITAYGRHWDGLLIMVANGLPYRASPHYQELFDMVATGKVDYMHRGLNEIYHELAVQKLKYPNLVISEDLALYYPMRVYYFVSVNRPELAERIEKGLKKAMADGSFKRIFDKHFADVIRQSQTISPRVITLKNPLLPEKIAPIRADWWASESLQKVIAGQP